MLIVRQGGIEEEDPQQLVDEAAEANPVEAARHGMGEPTHPAGEEAVRTWQALFDPEVAAARFRNCRAELCVDHGSQDGDDAVQGEGENECRSRSAGGDTGQYEDAGTDHRADADHRDIK